jgi:hypothetical protein
MEDTIVIDSFNLYNRTCNDLSTFRKGRPVDRYKLHGTYEYRSKGDKPDVFINYGVLYARKVRNYFEIKVGKVGPTCGLGRAAFLYALVRRSSFRFERVSYNGAAVDLEVSFIDGTGRYLVECADPELVLKYWRTKIWTSRRNEDVRRRFDAELGGDHNFVKYLRDNEIIIVKPTE